jgi:hypothetical protein
MTRCPDCCIGELCRNMNCHPANNLHSWSLTIDEGLHALLQHVHRAPGFGPGDKVAKRKTPDQVRAQVRRQRATTRELNRR